MLWQILSNFSLQQKMQELEARPEAPSKWGFTELDLAPETNEPEEEDLLNY